ncbi:hypothetical protein X560_1822 [Listeria fleischmannii 1991]|uniref:NEAT domain-containing protein n=2 Tax=Listeria fleischmannii TaxID=1069827 RepID=A0A2X3HMV3_9LIST|nr:hypothetical protein [Listeria fleischmannii]EMG26852.1 hypothetical protein LFLEISCH_14207 [Listeria fleischmannii subsp. fleischmannii LU2006-1]KMT58961.1 hypothetical protein X560_1822 [Listeria fleischmannii 1991]SQC72115.1 Uncharacterised protein [Listeria fleischmannii subsp. fleischmannii]
MRKKANLFVASVMVFAVLCWMAPLAKAVPVPEAEITYTTKTSDELSDMFLVSDYTFESPYVVMNAKNQATVMFNTSSATKITYTFQNKTISGPSFTKSHQFTISGLKSGQNHISLKKVDKNGQSLTETLTIDVPEKKTSKKKHWSYLSFKNLAATRELKQDE